MWKLKNSLNNEILKYFLLFSILILGFLWVFQALFFNSFYKEQKINDIELVINRIVKEQNNSNFEEEINNLALDKSVCIEIDDNNYDALYRSAYFGKGCLSSKDQTVRYKFDFISSRQEKAKYEILNQQMKSTTVVYAVKLSDEKYAFVNASIVPVDGTVSLIRKQLVVMTIIVLALSFVLAYFISNYISNPIKTINKQAKQLATGDFQVEFDNESEILEIKELTETLNYAKNELSKTEEFRRDLMANVSHDLKTPLTMIKAYAEMSMDLHSNNKEKQREDMETIISEADRLTVLVNDILTLSKMQSNIEHLDIDEFDLVALIKTILKRYQLYQETENYQFIFQHDQKKIMIQADKKKIEQVIYNLINNAINYTGDDNKVEIIVSTINDIKIEIKDTGPGIKKEDIPYIWDKYYKNKKKHKRNLVGTGIGLSIVKNILDLHHYQYGVDTDSDVGTTFYFVIPKKNED